jgi:adenylylsulfate kinase
MSDTLRDNIPHTSARHGLLVWLTGLSGSGKTTLAQTLQATWNTSHHPVMLLDGDVLRRGLCADLGFSEQDRSENMRRVAHVAELFLQQGFLVLAAFISPLEQDRARVRQIIGASRMLEVYVSCSLQECERRDVKGLYRRARAGEIPAFTGISAPYEAPQSPDLILDTETQNTASCVRQLHHTIQARLQIPPGPLEAVQDLSREDGGTTRGSAESRVRWNS